MKYSDKKMIDAVKTIKEGCLQRDCNYCIFFDKSKGKCLANDGDPDIWDITPLTPKLTDDEKAILRCLDKNYKWIARDENGNLYIYENMPKKKIIIWDSSGCHARVNLFENLFKLITWEDEKPYLIADLLEN